MNFRRIVIVVIVLAVVAAAVFFILQRSGTDQAEEAATLPAEDTVTVDTGVGTVASEGQVVPLQSSPLSVQIAGPVAEIFVAEGDQVSEGDPLLRLDTTDQEIALQQAQAGLAQANATLESARAGLRAAQTARLQAEIGVDAAEAQLSLVEADPQAKQVALSELGVAAAEAGITAASGNQALVLEGATSSQLLAAEAELRAAQQAAKVLQDNVQVEDLPDKTKEQLTIEFNAAVSDVNAAQARLDELRAGATSGERLASVAGVQQAGAQRDAAQAQLELLLAGAKEEQIAISRVGVEQAMAALAEAELALLEAETAVAQAEAGLAQSQAAAAATQQALDKMTLSAPFTGEVADLTVELGEVASPGIPVVTMADFGGWLVETTDLTELDVVAVGAGFPVEIRLDAFPGDTIAGTVTDVATVPGSFGGDVTYVVTISLDDVGDLPLRWGMTAEINIDTE
jgi:multidrug resistance efflux pump